MRTTKSIRSDIGFALLFYYLGLLTFLDRNGFEWLDFVYLSLWTVPALFTLWECRDGGNDKDKAENVKHPGDRTKEDV